MTLILSTVIPALIAAFAALKAGQAEKNSRPVSNGFASHVLRSLDEIKDELRAHIKSHDTP